MTKKDFELIAWVFRKHPEKTTEELVKIFAETLKLTNPRFDVNKFIRASKPREEINK
jgi:hypothetical protein